MSILVLWSCFLQCLMTYYNKITYNITSQVKNSKELQEFRFLNRNETRFGIVSFTHFLEMVCKNLFLLQFLLKIWNNDSVHETLINLVSSVRIISLFTTSRYKLAVKSVGFFDYTWFFLFRFSPTEVGSF